MLSKLNGKKLLGIKVFSINEHKKFLKSSLILIQPIV